MPRRCKKGRRLPEKEVTGLGFLAFNPANAYFFLLGIYYLYVQRYSSMPLGKGTLRVYRKFPMG